MLTNICFNDIANKNIQSITIIIDKYYYYNRITINRFGKIIDKYQIYFILKVSNYLFLTFYAFT